MNKCVCVRSGRGDTGLGGHRVLQWPGRTEQVAAEGSVSL